VLSVADRANLVSDAFALARLVNCCHIFIFCSAFTAAAACNNIALGTLLTCCSLCKFVVLHVGISYTCTISWCEGS